MIDHESLVESNFVTAMTNTQCDYRLPYSAIVVGDQLGAFCFCFLRRVVEDILWNQYKRCFRTCPFSANLIRADC